MYAWVRVRERECPRLDKYTVTCMHVKNNIYKNYLYVGRTYRHMWPCLCVCVRHSCQFKGAQIAVFCDWERVRYWYMTHLCTKKCLKKTIKKNNGPFHADGRACPLHNFTGHSVAHESKGAAIKTGTNLINYTNWIQLCQLNQCWDHLESPTTWTMMKCWLCSLGAHDPRSAA